VNQLITKLAHDLRGPLQLVSGYADLLAEGAAGPLNAKQQGYVGSVRSGVKRVLEVIEHWKESYPKSSQSEVKR
jgi:signal transduction histidine kinase